MRKCWIYEKTIVLTGATSGIGRAMVKKLVSNHSCHVIGIGRREDAFQELISELGDKKSLFEYRIFDVSKRKNWISFANDIKMKKIQVDILINNAGQLPKFKKFDKYTIDEFKRIIDVNFMASVYAINQLVPIISQSKSPAIINISSSAALCPLVGTSSYTASKSALKSFTETLIEDFRNQIFVAYVCPGFTKTNIFRNQNVEIEKIVDLFCSSCEKNTNRILKNILKRKHRIIVGKDAKLMDFFYRRFPRTFSHTCSTILKKSKIKLFEEIY